MREAALGSFRCAVGGGGYQKEYRGSSDQVLLRRANRGNDFGTEPLPDWHYPEPAAKPGPGYLPTLPGGKAGSNR